jgi:glutamate synthase (NADPH/NADH) large chain
VHHFALLIGYGCGAINPYLAFETIDDMIRQGCSPTSTTRPRARITSRPRQGRGQGDVQDGHLHHPELSRRADFRGRRPAIRIVIDKYFTWTASRVGGVGMDVIAQEVDAPPRTPSPTGRSTAMPGEPAANISGARTASITCSIPSPIHAAEGRCRSNNFKVFKEYSKLVNDQAKNPLHAARPARFQTGPSRFPSRKWNRSRRS